MTSRFTTGRRTVIARTPAGSTIESIELTEEGKRGLSTGGAGIPAPAESFEVKLARIERLKVAGERIAKRSSRRSLILAAVEVPVILLCLFGGLHLAVFIVVSLAASGVGILGDRADRRDRRLAERSGT